VPSLRLSWSRRGTSTATLIPRTAPAAHPGIGRYAAVARLPQEKDQPVKKLVLLLVVIALGAVIAKKVRSA
jgi:hypothetical protein